MSKLEINSAFRAALRSAAHSLKPVVLIGDKGLTDAVLKEIDRSLLQHGLIKVRAGGEDKDTRNQLLVQICDHLHCAPVHHLGKIFTLYRPTEDDPDGSDLLAFNKKIVPDPFGRVERKSNSPHIPKKLAAVGKNEVTRKRSPVRDEDDADLSPRERFFGQNERSKRPSLHKDTGSSRGAARVEKERSERRSSALGQRKTASPSPTERRASGAPRKRSALSLRSGIRRG